MFCLRSWLPLLFIPTNASPAFIFLFFVCTYFLNRPCVYCSLLLLVLFFTSCNWSDRCFFDFGSADWFASRHPITADSITPALGDEPSTAVGTGLGLGGTMGGEWTGIGVEWLRSLLGRREWMVDCMNVKIKL
ncbi:hypothetical protein ACRE_006950 [Hapsidospora chrysogenum ATCC 11550]|uniref:Uncharacterized protein n=1 Tax=Hapsidospora chrysogenum (strain ATCC 11550 / CBS 779.69 / DSM 880 / IAM 14645 / JCM 23072 / IMI 49137) TaxID=857340 RepID=A0A086TGL7_HAPC1|nr:hypothetical protein ACRE_006950 [Hapsidospora chrysogenum ATCC 11550]